MIHALIVAGSLLAAEPKGAIAADLQPPEHLEAAGQPLDVQREGHSAPYVGDFDGDGVQDLLVGQYDQGRLRIYRNSGSNSAPILGNFEWLTADGKIGKVPED